MKKVTIGLLLPSSSVISMGKDFERGLKSGLQNLVDVEQWDIELVPEFIGQGSKEKIASSVSKLLTYDDADIITGIISNKSITELAERFSKANKPLLISNLGEHLPDIYQYNENIFINSTNLWQQVWSLGYWGVKQFGKKGMFVSGLYDAGYSFPAMLQMGMTAADAEATMPFAVAPVSTPGQLADVNSVFAHIEQYKPDFVFATFCGEEASQFLEEFVKRGLHKTMPLLGFPYLIQDCKLTDEIEFYTTISTQTSIDLDKVLDSDFAANNIFPLLGYESGLIIASALSEGGVKSLPKFLRDNEVVSARGKLSVVSNLLGEHTHTFI